uniref:Protein 6 n=1 Tax=Vitis emaravirus TaxID=2812031 RepID=A0A831EH71_9VIRU|nr:protein 6 [Vitis emaravirus]
MAFHIQKLMLVNCTLGNVSDYYIELETSFFSSLAENIPSSLYDDVHLLRDEYGNGDLSLSDLVDVAEHVDVNGHMVSRGAVKMFLCYLQITLALLGNKDVNISTIDPRFRIFEDVHAPDLSANLLSGKMAIDKLIKDVVINGCNVKVACRRMLRSITSSLNVPEDSVAGSMKVKVYCYLCLRNQNNLSSMRCFDRNNPQQVTRTRARLDQIHSFPTMCDRFEHLDEEAKNLMASSSALDDGMPLEELDPENNLDH